MHACEFSSAYKRQMSIEFRSLRSVKVLSNEFEIPKVWKSGAVNRIFTHFISYLQSKTNCSWEKQNRIELIHSLFLSILIQTEKLFRQMDYFRLIILNCLLFITRQRYSIKFWTGAFAYVPENNWALIKIRFSIDDKVLSNLWNSN